MTLPSQTLEREHWSDSALGQLALPNERGPSEGDARLRERRRRERRAQRERGRRRRAGLALVLLVASTYLLGAARSGDDTRWPLADGSGVSKPSKPPPTLDPTPGQVASATAYLRSRRATTAFALV